MRLFKIAVSVQVFGFALAMAFLGCCFDYSLFAICGKDVPWYLDVIGGVVTNGVVVVVTILLYILQVAGIAMPLFS